MAVGVALGVAPQPLGVMWELLWATTITLNLKVDLRVEVFGVHLLKTLMNASKSS